MNLKLKMAILNTGKKQFEIAKELGWNDSRLSKIIRSYHETSEAEKVSLAEVLNLRIEDLFSND